MTTLTQTVQSATGMLDDETLGRVICAIKNCPFEGVRIRGDRFVLDIYDTNDNYNTVWIGRRDAAPDQSTEVALALAGERWPSMAYFLKGDAASCSATLYPRDGSFTSVAGTGSSLALAILAAALKAGGAE